MRLSLAYLARSTYARLWLVPARLALAWLSLLAVGATLLWLELSLAELRAGIAGATRFEGGTVRELSVSAAEAGAHQLEAPYLEAAAIAEAYGEGIPRILVPSDRVSAVYTDESKSQELELGVAYATRAALDGAGAEPPCVLLGQAAAKSSGTRLAFGSGAACRLVAPPKEWTVLDRGLTQPLLVVSPALAREFLPRLWEGRIVKALLAGPAGGGGPKRKGWHALTWSRGQPAEAERAERLMAAIARAGQAGALVGALSFFVLLFGQRRLLLREAGLWLSFGAARGRIRAWILGDMFVQLGVALLPAAALLAAFALVYRGRLAEFGGLFDTLAALAGLLLVSGLVFTVLFCRSALRGEPGHLLKELQ